MAKLDYDIIDPRPIAREAPYTFYLPTPPEIAAVSEGDIVKLIFSYPHQTEKWGTERMWVLVSEADDEMLRGVLDNDPDEPTSSIAAGDEILFWRHQMIDIRWKNPDYSPPSSHHRQYWDRCFVDQCVLDGLEPVEFLYRENRDMAANEDKYPDSGWRIRGRMGTATDIEVDEREVAYVALGAVLNRDDSWIAWIDSPVGISLMRDFSTNKYVQRD